MNDLGATSFLNGHKIIWNEKKNNWFYEDGRIAIEIKKCPKCGEIPTMEGHDACIWNLPGVMNACCGHGKEGYIQFNDGTIIRGVFSSIERAVINEKQMSQ